MDVQVDKPSQGRAILAGPQDGLRRFD
jgi:hypothetical protein